MAKRININTEDDKSEVKIADTFIGDYLTSTALNVRKYASDNAEIIGVLDINTRVKCDGRYEIYNGTRYLHIIANVDGKELDGYCQVRFLIKQF